MKRYREAGTRSFLRVLALVILTCLACSAWADEYHLFWYMGNTSNPADLVDQGGVTGSGSFTWNLSVVSGTNYYFGASNSNSYTGLTVSGSDTDADKITNTTGPLISAKGLQEGSGYYFYRVSFTTADNITLTYNSGDGTYTFDLAASCNMHIRYAWNGGSLTWKKMSSAGSNIFTYVDKYGGSDVCQISNDYGSNYTQYNATVTGNPSNGDYCTFSFTSAGSCATSGGSMEITKITASEYYVPGNGTNGNLSNWCNGVNWYEESKKDKINMTQIGDNLFSITYSSVSNTNGETNAEFKVKKENNWYDGWDEDTSEANGNTITKDGNIKILIPQANKQQNITITFNSKNNEIHIKCSDVASAPTVRMGRKPTKDGNNLTGNVFLAQTGGDEVTSIKVYYAEGEEPDGSSPYVECTGAPFVCGNLYNFAITDICTRGDGDYYLKAVAENSVAEGESDVAVYNDFVCCAGAIESLSIRSESENVVAGESYAFQALLQGGGALPTFVWDVKIGETGEWESQTSTTKDMYYPVPEDVAGGTKIYVRVTATGSNCEDTRTANAKVTACYTPAILSLSAPEDDPYAWESIDITSDIANSSYYEWSVNPTATLISPSATKVTFKGGTVNKSETDYTVTLTVGEDQCGSEVSRDVEIKVKPDKDNCTPAP